MRYLFVSLGPRKRSRMRKALLIAKREYIASVKTKGFIIGLIIAPLVMSASGIAFVVFKDRVDTDDKAHDESQHRPEDGPGTETDERGEQKRALLRLFQ